MDKLWFFTLPIIFTKNFLWVPILSSGHQHFYGVVPRIRLADPPSSYSYHAKYLDQANGWGVRHIGTLY